MSSHCKVLEYKDSEILIELYLLLSIQSDEPLGILNVVNILFINENGKKYIRRLIDEQIIAKNSQIDYTKLKSQIEQSLICESSLKPGVLQIFTSPLTKLSDFNNSIGIKKDLDYVLSKIDYKLDPEEMNDLKYDININRGFKNSNLMEKYKIPFFDGTQIAPLFIGLEYLHLNHNVLHYDLSMQNIMVDAETQKLCLIDFGDSQFMKVCPLVRYQLSHSILNSDILTPGIIFNDFSFKTEIEILVCFGLKFLGFSLLM